MMEYRREIALVYSIEEAMTKLNMIRGTVFPSMKSMCFQKITILYNH